MGPPRLLVPAVLVHHCGRSALTWQALLEMTGPAPARAQAVALSQLSAGIGNIGIPAHFPFEGLGGRTGA